MPLRSVRLALCKLPNNERALNQRGRMSSSPFTITRGHTGWCSMTIDYQRFQHCYYDPTTQKQCQSLSPQLIHNYNFCAFSKEESISYGPTTQKPKSLNQQSPQLIHDYNFVHFLKRRPFLLWWSCGGISTPSYPLQSLSKQNSDRPFGNKTFIWDTCTCWLCMYRWEQRVGYGGR